jgi:aspartate kinase
MMESKIAQPIVVKFGGSVLEDEAGFSRAADYVSATVKGGRPVVVVVSAMKGVTDGLIALSKKVNPDMDSSLVDELLSSGEKSSARLVAASLTSRGIKPLIIDTDKPDWPIITNDRHLDADPLMEPTRKKVQEIIVPLLAKGFVPVVCGFLGKTREGKTTTLGRGGSDTSAVVLGSCLEAKEVLLIKDVEGVYSSDPDKVTNSQFVDSLNGEEAEMLAAGGAKFLHLKALRYQSSTLNIRVTSLERTDSGTVIEGNTTHLDVSVTSSTVTMITIVGVDSNRMEGMARIAKAVTESGATISALSMEESSAILYVAGGTNVIDSVHKVLVSHKLGKAVSSFDGLSMITIRGKTLETQRGVIEAITRPLARSGINLYGMITIRSSIRTFVLSSRAEEALRLVREAMST